MVKPSIGILTGINNQHLETMGSIENVKKTKMVAIHTGKEITVTFDSPAPVQIDGETILGVTEYHATASSLVTASRK